MNSIQHRSSFITRKQAADAIDGAAFADLRDMPLTRSLVFNLEGLEELDMRPQTFVSAFTKLAGDWLATKGSRRAYLWVLEHPPMRSLNLHLLFHVPEELMRSFARMQKRWLKEMGIARRPRGFLKSQKVGIRPGTKNRTLTPGEYLVHLERVLGYNLKGVDRETFHLLRIEANDCRYHPQGVVYGKRLGMSESISRKARAKAGYRPPDSGRSILFHQRYRLSPVPGGSLLKRRPHCFRTTSLSN